ncbi:hypothetical protein AOLI_G00244260 [Acnodon oligacanthus]
MDSTLLEVLRKEMFPAEREERRKAKSQGTFMWAVGEGLESPEGSNYATPNYPPTHTRHKRLLGDECSHVPPSPRSSFGG